MAGEKRFTRIPPESTGDRVYMVHTAEIEFKNGGTYAQATYGNHTWAVGEMYVVVGFGMIHVHGTYDRGDGTGILSVHYNKTAKYENSTPDIDALISLDGVNVGEVAAFYDVYIPAQNIMGFDNPEYGLDIDRFGSAQVTFADGPPEMSQFGELRTSSKSLLAQYMFTKNRLPSEFSNALIGAGDIAFESGFQAVRLDVGDTLNDQATHTSNVYHPYLPGATNFMVMSTRVGDTGVSGLVRNWGMFDATDGFFFSLFETSLRLYHRYTFDGVTTSVPIEQADWNKDTLDGSADPGNPSGFNLDVSRTNIYWTDYQHIGGGRIRWGIFVNGNRIVAHELDMSNGGPDGSFLHNGIGNPNRPICWATKVISPTPGYTGTKSMYAYGAGVWAEGIGRTEIMEEGNPRAYADSHLITEDSLYTQGAYYLHTLRPLEQIPDEQGNNQENHSLYLPKYLTVDVYDENENNVRGELRIFSECVLRGAAYETLKYTSIQEDEYAFHIGHGPEVYRLSVNGPAEIDFAKLFSTIQNGTLKVNAETTTSVRRQDIIKVTGNDDPQGNGTSAVTIQVGLNPIYLSESVHFFADKGEIQIQNLSLTGPDSLNGNTYYLSLQDKDEAQIYSDLAVLNDDRQCRVLTISSLAGGTIDLGDELTITGAGTCLVIGVDGTSIRVERRNNAVLDVGLTSAPGSTDAGATTFTVDSVALASNTSDDEAIDYYLPEDRYTILGAVDGSGWANLTEGTGSPLAPVGRMVGVPPTQPGWTFMWAPTTRPTGAKEHNIRMNIQWKERTQ